MDDRVVVQELNVTGAEIHGEAKLRALCQALDIVDRGHFQLAERTALLVAGGTARL
jgi:hypothetical protein